MKKNQRLVFISIYCALALVLDYIKSFIPFLNMPAGGSINIALIPIVFCSFHLSTSDGFLSGILWWMMSSILGLNPYYISLSQYFFDYIFPSAIVGISAMFYKKKNILEIESGILLAMIVRTFCLTMSGAIYWPEGVASGSYAAWISSLAYNLPYNVATTIMLLIIIPILLRSAKKFML